MAEARFQLLGPLAVAEGERTVELGGTKQRMLLAHLLLHANKMVSAGQLIDALWQEDPPASANANLQTYVWRLRKRLPAEGAELVTHGNGYQLTVASGAIDAHVFTALTAASTKAARDGTTTTALDLVERAERLWRGDPLEDLPAIPQWQAELGGLIESRLAALEHRLGLQLTLGRHDLVATEAAVLLAEHPYRELLWQQYLLALDGAGRRAEALQAYTTARDRLVSELGIEPGPALRATQAAILRGDPPEAPVAEPRHVAPPRTSGPAQLPPDIADFTGRTDYVAELETALVTPTGTGAPAVAVIAGAPGTGKSSLAIHVAHRVREHFPDGQLYIDLAATGPQPRDPADVLAEFLHGLGVVGAALPAQESARAAAFRACLAGRRMLVVLDDAASTRQVLRLLPADAGCAVLITTRARMPELPGARQVQLEAFGQNEAELLLGRLTGADRIAAEPQDAAAIVAFCGYSPLAIRIAGARLAGRQAWSLRVLRDRLADESNRLGELRVGELEVRSSFELSIRQLPDPAVRAFARLSLLGGRDLPSWVVDAVLGAHGEHQVLDTLVDANLVALAGMDASGQPRYRLHDLLRCYAAELAETQSPRDRRDALTRTLSALLALARKAAANLPVAFGAVTAPEGGWQLDEVTARRVVADPLNWFDAERGLLAGGIDLAAEAGLDELAWQLATSAVPFFDLRGHYEDWHRTHRRALEVVRANGNRAGEAALLRGLGQVHLYRDEYAAAEHDMAAAARLYAELGDTWGQAIAVAGLGTAARVCERPDEALRHYRAALAGLCELGDDGGQAQMRNAIGTTLVQLDDLDGAASWLDEALEQARRAGDAHREAKVLTELGTLHRRAGRLPSALSCLRTALQVLEDLRDERCTAYALLGIGETLLAAGEPRQARGVGDRALEVFRRSGNRRGEATGLVLLDQAYRAERRPRQS